LLASQIYEAFWSKRESYYGHAGSPRGRRAATEARPERPGPVAVLAGLTGLAGVPARRALARSSPAASQKRCSPAAGQIARPRLRPRAWTRPSCSWSCSSASCSKQAKMIVGLRDAADHDPLLLDAAGRRMPEKRSRPLRRHCRPASEAHMTSAVRPPPPAAERRSRKIGIGLDIVEGLGCLSECGHRAACLALSPRPLLFTCP
jgi:hypothetical protein